jgi:hypothetical protein
VNGPDSRGDPHSAAPYVVRGSTLAAAILAVLGTQAQLTLKEVGEAPIIAVTR